MANNAVPYSAGGLDSGGKQELGEFCRVGGGEWGAFGHCRAHAVAVSYF
ncbi:MAG TPA: hypothetical protein VNZ53_29600 [Steroidobacteraceae bacterium]|nr:hypothetical protein [Steroidobacteraceae bacterium]